MTRRYRVHLAYDVEGWCYHHRCRAIKSYSPDDFDVTIGPSSAILGGGMDYDLLLGLCYGHIQRLREVRVNCDNNALELRVEQEVAACHKGYLSCYYRVWDEATDDWRIVDERRFDPDQVYK